MSHEVIPLAKGLVSCLWMVSTHIIWFTKYNLLMAIVDSWCWHRLEYTLQACPIIIAFTRFLPIMNSPKTRHDLWRPCHMSFMWLLSMWVIMCTYVSLKKRLTTLTPLLQDSLATFKTSVSTKAFVTLIPVTRFLSSMILLMFKQICSLDKSFIHIIFVWFFPSMCSPMLC